MKRQTMMYLLSAVVASTWRLTADQIQDLRPQLAKTVEAQAVDYVRLRDQLIMLVDTNTLISAASDPRLAWKERLVARIVLERKLRGSDIDALRTYHWFADPEFEPIWREMITGPAFHMVPLAERRFEEAGLWYYYIEYNWKETDEGIIGQRDPRLRGAWWAYAASGLKNQPEYRYLQNIALENMRTSSPFHTRNINMFYHSLLKEKFADAVPSLVERFDQFLRAEYSSIGSKPLDENLTWSQISTVRYHLKQIIQISDHRHHELLSNFINELPLFEPLRTELDAVRQRPAPEPTPEPPFRVMPTPEFLILTVPTDSSSPTPIEAE